MSLIKIIEKEKFVVLSKKVCPNCVKLKKILDDKEIVYTSIVIEDYMEKFDDDDFIFDDLDELKRKWNIKSYPMTFIDNQFIGDFTEIQKMNSFDTFNNMLRSKGVAFKDDEDGEF